jgi:hypothetical protein
MSIAFSGYYQGTPMTLLLITLIRSRLDCEMFIKPIDIAACPGYNITVWTLSKITACSDFPPVCLQ